MFLTKLYDDIVKCDAKKCVKKKLVNIFWGQKICNENNYEEGQVERIEGIETQADRQRNNSLPAFLGPWVRNLDNCDFYC